MEELRRPSAALAIALGGLLSAGLGADLQAQTQKPAATKGSVADSRIHALGRLEPAGGLVNIGSRPGQRIDSILVKAGDEVPAGGVLAVLEGRRQAEAQLTLAKLQKRQMEFQRKLKLDSLALERKQFDQTNTTRLDAATKIADLLKKTDDQATKLHAALGAMIPDREKLEAEGRFVELQAKTLQAQMERRLLEIEKELTLEKQALEDRQTALSDPPGPDDNPEFLLPDAQIALAEAALEQTQVVAPRAGRILDVIAHPGEVGTGQLLVMGDLSAMIAVAEVFQSDVLRVKVGDPVQVTILNETMTGKVEHVGTVVGRNQAMNMDPRALKDVRVVKVRVALDGVEPASRLLNMEADVVITPGGGG